MKVKVTNIKWDKDPGDNRRLPTYVTVDMNEQDYDTKEEMSDAAVDAATDKVGVCILSCDTDN